VTAALRAAILILVTCVVTVSAFQSSPPNRPWPPGVQKVSAESPVLTPEQALQTFYMPPGYRLELVASEPMIQEPVAIDWDTAGRLWAVEMPGFMANLTGSNEHDTIGRVVVLEDLDADGRMDKRTVFADGLVLARSLKVLDRGVLVGEPPNAWLMRDTDGDLRMDTKELVTNEYGRREVDPQNNANGFEWSLDNVMRTAGQSDIDLRLKNGKIETLRTLRRGEWGVTHDDAGRTYRNTNESALHVDIVPTAYFARNPSLLRTRGSYERLATDNEDLNIVWPVRPNPGTNRAYQYGIDRPDGSLVKFTAVCAPLVYRGDRLPRELYGSVFVADPAANLVSRLILDDSGPALSARKAYEQGEFLASTDERFRPVFLSNAPDGTLYVVDMYRGIIEHRISITMYLRDQILARKLEGPTGLGRIYRVAHETTKRDTSRGLSRATNAALVTTLSHPNGWWRDTAQRLLVERFQTAQPPAAQNAVAPGSSRKDVEQVRQALVKLAAGAPDVRTRLHALWTLDGIDLIEPDMVIGALQDASRYIRLSAVRLGERWVGEAGHRIHAALMTRVDDEDAAVRRQLAASLGGMPPGAREDAIVSILRRHGNDPVLLDAALSGLRGAEMAALEKMLGQTSGQGAQPNAEPAIAMLAATVVRGAQDAAVQKLLASIAQETLPEGQRMAMLRGTEIALLNAPMPGASTGRRGNPPPAAAGAPCPTCPGGRAGPGGAYAFPRPQDTAAFSALAASRGGQRLRLNREPAAFSTLAARTDDMGTRAAAVLARVTWAGKPGEPAAAPPLTAVEQQRYDAGQEIYRNICQACHQPDGRGQDRLAPSLVGSAFTLAAPEIPIRILLSGKEGPIGLMPPIGATISDEQIAAVLTYIRRDWGHAATPVDAGVVSKVRALTTDRTRPWTNAELEKVGSQK
jgi:mono/diheme cytochrome c family protein